MKESFFTEKMLRNGKWKMENGKFKSRCFPLSVFRFPLLFLCLCGLILLLSSASSAQKIAVISPEKTSQNRQFSEKLEIALSDNFKVLNESLSETAFHSMPFENPFNLTTIEARNVGAAIGCDYFLLVKSKTLRRTSFTKNEFYEAYAAVYVVSARTGRLVFWKLKNSEAEKPAEAEKMLSSSVGDLSTEITNRIKAAAEEELKESIQKIAELPDENSPEAKNFRPPLPFRRIKPEYTSTANLYSVEATVDVLVDIDEKGEILRTEIVRWAGYGLDESVTENIRRMQWRPAERNGKFLPMRVLLRYNFKKIEPEEQ